MKVLLTIMFMFASGGITYFFGSLLTWVAQKIRPEIFTKLMGRKEINRAVYIMTVSIILLGIVFLQFIVIFFHIPIANSWNIPIFVLSI